MSEIEFCSMFLPIVLPLFSVFAMHFWLMVLLLNCLLFVVVVVVGLLVVLMASIPLNRDRIDAYVNLIVWLSCGKSKRKFHC